MLLDYLESLEMFMKKLSAFGQASGVSAPLQAESGIAHSTWPKFVLSREWQDLVVSFASEVLDAMAALRTIRASKYSDITTTTQSSSKSQPTRTTCGNLLKLQSHSPRTRMAQSKQRATIFVQEPTENAQQQPGKLTVSKATVSEDILNTCRILKSCTQPPAGVGRTSWTVVQRRTKLDELTSALRSKPSIVIDNEQAVGQGSAQTSKDDQEDADEVEWTKVFGL